MTWEQDKCEASPYITMHLHSLVSATTSPTDHLEPPVERQGRGVVRSHGTCFALHNQTQNRPGHGTIWQLFVSLFSLLNTPPVSSSLFLLPDPVKPLYATCQYPRIKYCASSIFRRPLLAFILVSLAPQFGRQEGARSKSSLIFGSGRRVTDHWGSAY